MEVTLKQLWLQVLERLQSQLPRPAFETWIETAALKEMQGNCLVIQAANPSSSVAVSVWGRLI